MYGSYLSEWKHLKSNELLSTGVIRNRVYCIKCIGTFEANIEVWIKSHLS